MIGVIKIGENFRAVQSTRYWRNFSQVKIFAYTVIASIIITMTQVPEFNAKRQCKAAGGDNQMYGYTTFRTSSIRL